MAYTYEDLINDNVLFLLGTLADLNLYLPNAPSTIPTDGAYVNHPKKGLTNTYKGTAIEGAFYLTTDTHRLYIGRKVLSSTVVYPEEISTGIATVVDTGDLADAQRGGAAHDGDFYYIKSSNVLAVYESDSNGNGQWVQINSPTNISDAKINFGTESTTLNYATTAVSEVFLKTKVQTQGSTTAVDSKVYIKAGDNITIKPSAETGLGIEISAANSQSNLGIEPSSATANNAPVVLSDGINLDTKVHFTGKNDTTVAASHSYVLSADTVINPKKTYYVLTTSGGSSVYTAVSATNGNPSNLQYYERENIITVAGPGINGTLITNQGSINATSGTSGFKFEIEVQDGDKNSARYAMLEDNYSILDPIISYGHSTAVEAKFRGGTAKLDVYTAGEADQIISAKITDQLKGVDALHYQGTVTESTLSTISTGIVHVGDVYKAADAFNLRNTSSADGENHDIRIGDLLIAQGTEYALSADTSVDSSKTYYTRTGNNINNYVYTPVVNPTGNPHTLNYYEYTGVIPSGDVVWNIVPSGDEPLLVGQVNTIGNPFFGLEDSHIEGSYEDLSGDTKINKRPLWVTFDNIHSELIEALASGSADNFVMTLHHKAPNVTAANAIAISAPATSTTMWSTSTTAVDTIGTLVLKFTALNSIEKDGFGHITKVIGLEISLLHNYVNEFTAIHSATGTQGVIKIGANDLMGLSNNTTKGTLTFKSDTLQITADNTTGLKFNLVWGSF